MNKVISLVRGLYKLIGKGFSGIKKLLADIRDKGIGAVLKDLREGIKKILMSSLDMTAVLIIITEFLQKILGFIGIGTAVASGTLGAKQIFDFGKAIVDPQGQMLDWLSEAFAALPSLSELIAGIDSMFLELTADYFSPPISMTYLLKVTGVGACFNQYLQALISTLIFVFSVFLVKWAFSNNFTFTKSVTKQ